MPRQDSRVGHPITSSGFTNPFETINTRYGQKGLNLNANLDALGPDELSRMTNADHSDGGDATSRPGQTVVATTGATNLHSIRRLNDPTDGSFTRIIGADTSLYRGQTTLSSIDTGYSGDPLSLVPTRPPFSGETWMFVGDRSRMRKVRVDGLDLPIGLAAPSTAPTATLVPARRTPIAYFDPAVNGSVQDGTSGQFWTANAGFSFSDPPVATGIPLTFTDSGTFQTNPGTAVMAADAGYNSFWGLARTLDLSTIGGVAAEDEDIIHLILNFGNPSQVGEVRFYFVCSETFSPSILPGTASGVNDNYFLKSFTPGDFTQYIGGHQLQIDATEVERVYALREQGLKDESLTTLPDGSVVPSHGHRPAPAYNDTIVSARTPERGLRFVAGSGVAEFLEIGITGVPLRRGDFKRYGTVATRGWGTITGLVIYVATRADTNVSGPFDTTFIDMYMTGGYGLDNTDPAAQSYDWRYTHYDSRTGAESNPSPIMAETAWVDAVRRAATITPTANGDSAIRQQIYRRGGTLTNDWQFVGVNTADGGTYQDESSDTEITASSGLLTDHYQPVPTVDETGTTVLAQPVHALWGPIEGLMLACGDPNRPGDVYWCKPGEPDHWPAESHVEVCAPSEELQNGCLFGGQAFTFSRERLYILYPHLTGDASITSMPTQCKKGLVNRWGLTVGRGGIYFVSDDGVYRTAGGPEEWLSQAIDPLFRGEAKNGYNPIDLTVLTAIRLEIFEHELYFGYRDTGGVNQIMVLNLDTGSWRHYNFDKQVSVLAVDEGDADSAMLMGGRTTGTLYSHDGFSDAGTAISVAQRTGALDFGRPREEKLLGDQILDVDRQATTINLQNYLNDETITNPIQALTDGTGWVRAIFDSFGTTPQRARNISSHISWSSATARPVLKRLGTSTTPQPDQTVNRVTNWDDLGHPDESYVTGVTFDCDTGGMNRNIIIERDFAGVVSTVATLQVNTAGRHKVKFSWPALPCNMIRVRPDDECAAWILYRADWIFQPEPPRIAGWDIHFENAWDQYYTGVDLYCDTFGVNKTIEVYVDQVLIKTETVNTNGRKVHHITLPWGRGHVFHLVATDANPGLLYTYRWHTENEPSEQTNWNQNFTVEGIESDKYLKAIVFQCDTFGLDKTVTVECDGVVVQTLTINANGRKVVEKAFPQQLGRVFRIYPTDNNPGRLYSLWWVFDQEPLALDRWETQETDHNMKGWHYPTYGTISLKSVSTVILRVIAYTHDGVSTTEDYTLATTGGTKQKRLVTFRAGKGVLYKYILFSDQPFWLYREETFMTVRSWNAPGHVDAHPFGNDDLDTTRTMTKAGLAAARGGGGTG